MVVGIPNRRPKVTATLAALLVSLTPIADPLGDLEAGMDAASAGDHARAVLLLTRAMEADNGFDRLTLGKSHFARGQCRFHLGQHADALADFAKAEKLLPRQATYLMLVSAGRAHRALGHRKEALAKFDAAVALAPKEPDAYLYRAFAHRDGGEGPALDRAISDYNRAAELASGDGATEALAVASRGQLHQERGEYKAALDDYERAVKVAPDWADGHNLLAWLRATCPEEEFRDACEAVDHAYRAGRLAKWKNPNHYETIAAAWAQGGNFELATKYQLKFLEAPDCPPAEADGAKQRLNLYKKGQSFREPKR
jgi:tetratricopeptide (TPR) repeat protein